MVEDGYNIKAKPSLITQSGSSTLIPKGHDVGCKRWLSYLQSKQLISIPSILLQMEQKMAHKIKLYLNKHNGWAWLLSHKTEESMTDA